MSNPTHEHEKGVKRVLRYLKSNPPSAVSATATASSTSNGFSDSDYGRGHRSEARRSTTGLVFFMASGPVSWGLKRQSTTAQSTVEAEYIAVNAPAREAAWIRHFLEETGGSLSPLPYPIKNRTTKAAQTWDLGRDPHCASSEAPHPGVLITTYVNDEIKSGRITLVHVPSADGKRGRRPECLSNLTRKINSFVGNGHFGTEEFPDGRRDLYLVIERWRWIPQ